jgi:hypothetical protein
VLEFLNGQPKLKGKVAVFGAWDAFDRIFNEQRSGFPVISGFDSCGGKTPTANEKLINAMLNDSYRPFEDHECLDVFTHYEAMEYLKTRSLLTEKQMSGPIAANTAPTLMRPIR